MAKETKEVVDVEALKAKHGELKELSCGGLTAYFKKPDLRIWRFAMKSIDKSVTEFKRVMAVNCWVGGDKELIGDPYLDEVAEAVNDFIEYSDAEVERDGNAYVVRVGDKQCRLRPVTMESQITAERNNPDDVAFMTQQNLLGLLWIDGDEELRDGKKLEYHLPVLKALKKLRERHVLSIKNV